jgi:16S rRNA G966 N2-methylase RsmD
MGNERKTENIIRKLLQDQGYSDNDNIKIEEQVSDNPKIDQLLSKASKKGKSKGYPDFIVSFVDKPDYILVIECKSDISKHESKERKQYANYAVDGALLYASHLKDKFNVLAIGASGETEQELRLSHFLWLKGKHSYKAINDQHLISKNALFTQIQEQSKPIREEELIKKAIEYNQQLHELSIPETERCTLISSILVALQDKSFTSSYKAHYEDLSEGYNPNPEMIKDLINACQRVLLKNEIGAGKSEIIIREYEAIKQSYHLDALTITKKERKKERNTVLRDLIDDIQQNIMPYIESDKFDVLGQFYTQFIRYAGSDSKTGLVLTPRHITELFCDLAEINQDDVVYDPCCGTGGFLVSAMNRMIEKADSDEAKHKHIKSKQLIGVEIRPDMFSHVCSNMMMRGDGKSNIHRGDCFDEILQAEIKRAKPNKVLLNPPYDKGEDAQLEFVEAAMECIPSSGIAVAICQMSTAISSKAKTVEVRRRLLKKHTLEAVLSMPDDVFYPVGVVTCILVLKANSPHPENKETFFGYFKDDGFIKIKNKGRIDQGNKWEDAKKQWLDAYLNKKNIPGLSVTQMVKHDDEWCAEAYMETDYSQLTDADFIKTIKEYVAFQFLHGE